MITSILTAVFGSYIITVVLTKGSIFNKIRRWTIEKTPWLQKDAMWPAVELAPPHYFLCRLCLGALVSAFFAWGFNVNWFLVYGVSYFLATQER
jgi:hypothetical protein